VKKKKKKEELLRKKAKLDAEIKEITDQEIQELQEIKANESRYRSALSDFKYRAGFFNTNKPAIQRLGTFISMCTGANPQTTDYKKIAKACKVENLVGHLEEILEPPEKMPDRVKFRLDKDRAKKINDKVLA
jgi:hypothetical protein